MRQSRLGSRIGEAGGRRWLRCLWLCLDHAICFQELHLDSNRIEEVTEGVLNRTLNLTVLVLSNNKLEEDRIAPRAWIDLL